MSKNKRVKLIICVSVLLILSTVIEASKVHWEELSKNNKKNKVVDVTDSEEETQA